MSRFHISPDGQPRSCTATKQCRYGDNTPHFSSAEDARTAYEASQRGSFSQASLQKNASEYDDVFLFEGAELDSKIWALDTSPGLFGRSLPLVALTAHGYNYAPKQSFDPITGQTGWVAEVDKYSQGGWESTKPTEHFKTFAELAENVESLAIDRAKKRLKRDLTGEEARSELRRQKRRYDRLSK